jgi:hypothetical protein
VNKIHTRLKFVGRSFGVALCYVVAFQAFFAAYSIAGAASDVGGTIAGFIICHSAGDDATPRPDSGNVPNVPCALCAMATSAGGLLPIATSAAAAPLTVSHRLRPPYIVVTRAPSAVRAGLARAPPNVV